MAFKAVVFDLFDTLVDLYMEKLPLVEFAGRTIPSTTGHLHAALPSAAEIDFERFAGTLLELDREFRQTRYAQHLELPTLERFSVLCERLGLAERLGAAADAVPAALVDVHMGMLCDFADTPGHHREVLAKLKGGARIGLCSNFSHTPTAVALLARYGLEEYFDAVVVSEDIGIRKPRGEIFEAVLTQLGVRAGEALHVGDNLSADVQGAAEVGMRTAWITRRVVDPERKLRDYEGPTPDWQIRDLGELPGLLEAATRSE